MNQHEDYARRAGRALRRKPRAYPAQIVFTEASGGGKWFGRLLNRDAAVDTESGRQAAAIECKITEEGPTTYTLVTHGGSINGRRYRSFETLTEAQKAAIKWAGRRFKVMP